jgi:hypothetical protein
VWKTWIKVPRPQSDDNPSGQVIEVILQKEQLASANMAGKRLIRIRSELLSATANATLYKANQATGTRAFRNGGKSYMLDNTKAWFGEVYR